MKLTAIFFIFLQFSSLAMAGYYDSCSDSEPLDIWSKTPQLKLKCTADANSPAQMKAQRIFNEIVQSNRHLFHNPEIYKNICLEVTPDLDNWGKGMALTDIGKIRVSEKLVREDPTGEKIAALLAHELGHMMRGHQCSSFINHYHPDLMKDPRYSQLYQRLKNTEASHPLTLVKKLTEIQNSLQEPDPKIDYAILTLQQRVFLTAPDRLPPKELRNFDRSLPYSRRMKSNEIRSLFSKYRDLDDYDNVIFDTNSPLIERMEAKLYEMAEQAMPKHERMVFAEFEADRTGFQLLERTNFNTEQSFGKLFRLKVEESEHLGAESPEACYEMINSGQVPPFVFRAGDYHPPDCRRLYEATVKYPSCKDQNNGNDGTSGINSRI